MAESNKYTYDEWVGKVRPDPSNIDPLTLLQGYIGQSSESGHIRVYSDETLNNFVEVPEDAIIYAQQLSQAESSLGGSKLWLRSDVVITFGDPKMANRPKSTFLEGDLMQQYITQYGDYDPTGGTGPFGGQPAGQGGQLRQTVGIYCVTQPIQCLPQTGGRNCSAHCPAQHTGARNCSAHCPAQHTGARNCTTMPIHCTAQGTGPFIYRTQLIHCLPQVTNTTAYMGGYYGTFNPYMM